MKNDMFKNIMRETLSRGPVDTKADSNVRLDLDMTNYISADQMEQFVNEARKLCKDD